MQVIDSGQLNWRYAHRCAWLLCVHEEVWGGRYWVLLQEVLIAGLDLKSHLASGGRTVGGGGGGGRCVPEPIGAV